MFADEQHRFAWIKTLVIYCHSQRHLLAVGDLRLLMVSFMLRESLLHVGTDRCLNREVEAARHPEHGSSLSTVSEEDDEAEEEQQDDEDPDATWASFCIVCLGMGGWSTLLQ